MSTIDRAPATPLTRRELREHSPETFWGKGYPSATGQSETTGRSHGEAAETILQPTLSRPEARETLETALAEPEAPVPVVDPLDPFAGWVAPKEQAILALPANGRRRPASEGAAAANSRAIWWYVALPIIQSLVFVGIVVGMLLTLFPDPLSILATPADPTTLLLVGAASVAVSLVGFLASIRLLMADRSHLRAQGFSSSVSPWWHLLGPVIVLSVRAVSLRNEAPRGSLPLTAYLCAYIAPGVALGVALIVVQQLT